MQNFLKIVTKNKNIYFSKFSLLLINIDSLKINTHSNKKIMFSLNLKPKSSERNYEKKKSLNFSCNGVSSPWLNAFVVILVVVLGMCAGSAYSLNQIGKYTYFSII